MKPFSVCQCELGLFDAQDVQFNSFVWSYQKLVQWIFLKYMAIGTQEAG